MTRPCPPPPPPPLLRQNAASGLREQSLWQDPSTPMARLSFAHALSLALSRSLSLSLSLARALSRSRARGRSRARAARALARSRFLALPPRPHPSISLITLLTSLLSSTHQRQAAGKISYSPTPTRTAPPSSIASITLPFLFHSPAAGGGEGAAEGPTPLSPKDPEPKRKVNGNESVPKRRMSTGYWISGGSSITGFSALWEEKIGGAKKRRKKGEMKRKDKEGNKRGGAKQSRERE
jgi:hypothetical protein